LLRAKARIVGRKYIRNPNPKNGKKNIDKMCMAPTSLATA
jgi:hypothetical protein